MPYKPLMSAEEVNEFIDREFPQISEGGRQFHIEAIEPGLALMRLEPDDRHVRPGGTISGPTLFSLADVSAYVVILAHIGPVALAVTTNLNINFLKKPPLAPLLCRGKILKLGKRLCVVEADIFPATGGDSVAHATATYSIPPR